MRKSLIAIAAALLAGPAAHAGWRFQGPVGIAGQLTAANEILAGTGLRFSFDEASAQDRAGAVVVDVDPAALPGDVFIALGSGPEVADLSGLWNFRLDAGQVTALNAIFASALTFSITDSGALVLTVDQEPQTRQAYGINQLIRGVSFRTDASATLTSDVQANFIDGVLAGASATPNAPIRDVQTTKSTIDVSETF